MSLGSLHNLYIIELKDLYDAKNRITKALPKMAEAALSQKTLPEEGDTDKELTCLGDSHINEQARSAR